MCEFLCSHRQSLSCNDRIKIQVGQEREREDPELSGLSVQWGSVNVGELEICRAKRACTWFSALDFLTAVQNWALKMCVYVKHVDLFMVISLS